MNEEQKTNTYTISSDNSKITLCVKNETARTGLQAISYCNLKLSRTEALKLANTLIKVAKGLQ